MNRFLMVAMALAAIPSSTVIYAAEYENPLLAGFHADPSICRVGGEYYIACSSFEYFPGVPIYHSKDLVNWRLVGHCLTRKSQLPLDKMRASGGIFAPTLRYHGGKFYMITTNVWGGGNFYVTATDAAGPWSEPVWLDVEGIDPSMMFDDNGTVYYCRHVGGADGYIGLTTLDIETGKLQGELKNIWGGTGGVWAEGPHLYKIGGKYYLMISEGGTSYNHAVTIARSDSPWGPYDANEDNPILTHREQLDRPVQAVGHADLVDTPDGWWMVCLGIRPQGGPFHHIGRETYLAPVSWSEAGWPVVNSGNGIEIRVPAPQLEAHPWPVEAKREEFDDEVLAPHWNYLRNPFDANYSLSARPGFLRLTSSKVKLTDVDSPTFIGRKQTGLQVEASALIDFAPTSEGEEAGLVVRGNDENHYVVGITLLNGRRQAFSRRVLKGKSIEPVTYVALADGSTELIIHAYSDRYGFAVRQNVSEVQELATYSAQDLATEKIGGFTGAYIGMYAVSDETSPVSADFDWFDYHVTKR